MIPAWIGQTVVEVRRRAADSVGSMRFDSRARVASRPQSFRALSALFCQRAGRNSVARPARPAGGGEPGAGRTVRRDAAATERAQLIGLVTEEDRDASPSSSRRLRGRRHTRAGRGASEAAERPRPASCSSAGSTLRRTAPRRASDPSGGLMLHFIDVTEQKNLEVQFAQSQKMQAVGQLAGGVAHDFNNLLTAMIGFCDLLLMRFRPGDPSFADIMQIKQNANRAANLVRQLLAFSRQQTLAAAHPQHHRRAVRAVAPAAPADRREHRAEGGARPRPRPRQGRPGPARTGHHQPRGQRARRDAGRRHVDDPHRQCHARRRRCGAATRSCRPAITC